MAGSDVPVTYAVVHSLIEALERIRDVSEGRRHYDGEDGLSCFNALGDITDMVDATLGPKGRAPLERKTCVECGEPVRLLSRTRGLIYDTHDAPKPCRQVCPGSGQLADAPTKPRKRKRR